MVIKIDKKSYAKEKAVPIAKIVLYALAITGVLSVALIAPNAMQAFTLFGLGKRKYSKEYIQHTIQRLHKNGLIVFKNKNDKKLARLTKKGKAILFSYQIRKKLIGRGHTWDRKWRIVIFDIREERRKTRDKLRTALSNFGFIKLQNSVWVYPYQCEDIIALLKAECKIGKDVLYIVAQKIENDKKLKKLFKLS